MTNTCGQRLRQHTESRVYLCDVTPSYWGQYLYMYIYHASPARDIVRALHRLSKKMNKTFFLLKMRTARR